MFNLKKEKMKKNIFLTLSIISSFILIAGLMCTIMGDKSPVKFIINESPVKLVVPPFFVFIISFALYRNSKKAIKENTK
ncbi:hypothetical protein [uncultured Clostridium sp.]|uniref:hypothetical protein n=1 Tax=uncultured Clostridium sp. TaxID=59620 RepID=UPI00260528E8|nr:hypothetical protein [uncultured Clostridium sp.]